MQGSCARGHWLWQCKTPSAARHSALRKYYLSTSRSFSSNTTQLHKARLKLLDKHDAPSLAGQAGPLYSKPQPSSPCHRVSSRMALFWLADPGQHCRTNLSRLPCGCLAGGGVHLTCSAPADMLESLVQLCCLTGHLLYSLASYHPSLASLLGTLRPELRDKSGVALSDGHGVPVSSEVGKIIRQAGNPSVTRIARILLVCSSPQRKPCITAGGQALLQGIMYLEQ